jgi:hypothetical protein
VVAVDLDYLYRGPGLANHPRLLAEGPQVAATGVLGAEQLLLTAVPAAWLTEMPK